MYHFKDEDVLLCEAFANAVDIFREDNIKNPQINITLEETNLDRYYINFHNNGTPMNNKQFEHYHVIAGSYKEKGGGIGFAGVGAKVFLVSKSGGEIFTITGKNNSDFQASRMFKTDDDVMGETINDLSEIFGNVKYVHKFGTTYRVKLTKKSYLYFKKNLPSIIQFWWNFALITKQFKVTVNNIEVTPFDPDTKVIKQFIWKNNKIKCYFWIAKNKVPKEQLHMVFSVYGKRITNEVISQPLNLKSGYYERIFCLADVSHLAKHIGTDKESFHGNWETNRTKSEVQKFFIKFLTEQGLTGRDLSKPEPDEITNKLTKELDRLLQTKEFQELNPFLSRKKQSTPSLDPEGDITISDVKGEGSNGSTRKKKNGTDLGNETDSTPVEDEQGTNTGRKKERQSGGIQIIPTDEFPDEPEEAWVDLARGAVCINIAHPFYRMIIDKDRFGILERYNVTRILIDALIKFKNEELREAWDPKTTIDKCRDLLHKTWK